MRRCLAALAALALVALPSAARASSEEPEPDKADTTHPGARTPYAVTLNVAAPVIGHWGGNFEWSFMEGHALVTSLSYVSAPKADSEKSKNIHGAGGEVGYRFYTGSSGPVGGFFGPSALFGLYFDPELTGRSSFSVVAGAIDGGVQARIGRTVLLGAGLGLQVTQAHGVNQNTYTGRAMMTAWSGILPRALFTIGGAFGD